MSAVDNDTHTNSHRGAENASTGSTERPSGMSADGEGATFDLIAHLTEVEGWVKRTSRIEIGEPFAQVDRIGRVIYARCDQPWRPDDTTVYTPPPPEPEPWELIPEGRENARDLYVNGVPGRYYLNADSGDLETVDAEGDPALVIIRATTDGRHRIASVTPIHILADDDVAVPRWLLDEARAEFVCERHPDDDPIGCGWKSMIGRILDAVDGGDRRG